MAYYPNTLMHGIIMVGSLVEIVVITFEIPTTQLMFILHAEKRAGEVSQAVFVTQKTS